MIGGYFSEGLCYFKACFKYEISHNKQTKIADLNIDKRSGQSSAVFEGKIVATGGFRYTGRTNSAESNDYYENKWSHLPDMVGWRNNHSSFSMGKKIFVIGRYCIMTLNFLTLLQKKLLCSK